MEDAVAVGPLSNELARHCCSEFVARENPYNPLRWRQTFLVTD
jgi:hypothetical protein